MRGIIAPVRTLIIAIRTMHLTNYLHPEQAIFCCDGVTSVQLIDWTKRTV